MVKLPCMSRRSGTNNPTNTDSFTFIQTLWRIAILMYRPKHLIRSQSPASIAVNKTPPLPSPCPGKSTPFSRYQNTIDILDPVSAWQMAVAPASNIDEDYARDSSRAELPDVKGNIRTSSRRPSVRRFGLIGTRPIKV